MPNLEESRVRGDLLISGQKTGSKIKEMDDLHSIVGIGRVDKIEK